MNLFIEDELALDVILSLSFNEVDFAEADYVPIVGFVLSIVLI